MVNKHAILGGVFMFILVKFSLFGGGGGGVFNITAIVQFVLVGYKKIIANLVLCLMGYLHLPSHIQHVLME